MGKMGKKIPRKEQQSFLIIFLHELEEVGEVTSEYAGNVPVLYFAFLGDNIAFPLLSAC